MLNYQRVHGYTQQKRCITKGSAWDTPNAATNLDRTGKQGGHAWNIPETNKLCVETFQSRAKIAICITKYETHNLLLFSTSKPSPNSSSMAGHEKPSPVMVSKNGIRLPTKLWIIIYGLYRYDMTKWYAQIPLDDIFIYIILYHIILYYIILYYIISYHIISYYIILYRSFMIAYGFDNELIRLITESSPFRPGLISPHWSPPVTCVLAGGAPKVFFGVGKPPELVKPGYLLV